MNYRISSTIILLLISMSLATAQNSKEILLIGTMHQVGTIKRNAYRPMLKKAIQYAPEAIYVERQMNDDEVSLKNYRPDFFRKADSLRRITTFNMDEIRLLKQNDLEELKPDEAKLLAKYFYCQLDYSNYQYYSYLSRFGVRPAGKLSDRTENIDLSIPLAIKMDIREIRSMDDQTYMKEYHDNWRACEKDSALDGEVSYFKKDMRKASFHDVLGFFFGLGKMVNKEKISLLYHRINSFEYRESNCDSCDKGNYYWDYRNTQMASNIAKQVHAGTEERSVVVVGAGHIYGLIEAFERDHPEITIKLYRNL